MVQNRRDCYSIGTDKDMLGDAQASINMINIRLIEIFIH